MNNPFNCAKPGNLFCGFERLRQGIYSGFSNGKSFALLGGRRCGKTSMLLQIQNDLLSRGLPGLKPLPCILDMQSLGCISPSLLFEKMYACLTRYCDAPPWRRPSENHEYDGFLEQMQSAQPALSSLHGDRWLAVYLIDELDSALHRLKNDQFFQNMRHLLMMSPFRSYFRVVATGVRDMSQLISSGSSPLNNLTCLHLRTFNKTEALSLCRQGFSDPLDDDALDRLITLTGRHPYLLQGLLEKVWDARQGTAEISKRDIKDFAIEFLHEHRDMQKWTDMFGEAEHHVYRAIMDSRDGAASVASIRGAVRPDLAHRVDDALRVLSYHGIIDDADEDEPVICGTMFRDWYLRNTPIVPIKVESRPQPHPESQAAAFAPVINVSVNPVIDVNSHSSSSVKASLPDALRLIDELKNMISGMSIDDLSKKKAALELDKAALEVQSGEKGKKIDSTEMESSLKKASGILKSAGTTAEMLRSFMDKAQALGPYIGMAASWLMNM